jgi:hypothetical protein
MVVPVAVLALGWGSRLVMFDVPLIGDHVNLGEAGEGLTGSVCLVQQQQHANKGQDVSRCCQKLAASPWRC